MNIEFATEDVIISAVIARVLSQKCKIQVNSAEWTTTSFSRVAMHMSSYGENTLAVFDPKGQHVGIIQFLRGAGLKVLSHYTSSNFMHELLRPVEDMIPYLES